MHHGVGAPVTWVWGKVWVHFSFLLGAMGESTGRGGHATSRCHSVAIPGVTFTAIRASVPFRQALQGHQSPWPAQNFVELRLSLRSAEVGQSWGRAHQTLAFRYATWHCRADPCGPAYVEAAPRPSKQPAPSSPPTQSVGEGVLTNRLPHSMFQCSPRAWATESPPLCVPLPRPRPVRGSLLRGSCYVWSGDVPTGPP